MEKNNELLEINNDEEKRIIKEITIYDQDFNKKKKFLNYRKRILNILKYLRDAKKISSNDISFLKKIFLKNLSDDDYWLKTYIDVNRKDCLSSNFSMIDNEKENKALAALRIVSDNFLNIDCNEKEKLMEELKVSNLNLKKIRKNLLSELILAIEKILILKKSSHQDRNRIISSFSGQDSSFFLNHSSTKPFLCLLEEINDHIYSSSFNPDYNQFDDEDHELNDDNVDDQIERMGLTFLKKKIVEIIDSDNRFDFDQFIILLNSGNLINKCIDVFRENLLGDIDENFNFFELMYFFNEKGEINKEFAERELFFDIMREYYWRDSPISSLEIDNDTWFWIRSEIDNIIYDDNNKNYFEKLLIEYPDISKEILEKIEFYSKKNIENRKELRELFICADNLNLVIDCQYNEFESNLFNEDDFSIILNNMEKEENVDKAFEEMEEMKNDGNLICQKSSFLSYLSVIVGFFI